MLVILIQTTTESKKLVNFTCHAIDIRTKYCQYYTTKIKDTTNVQQVGCWVEDILSVFFLFWVFYVFI